MTPAEAFSVLGNRVRIGILRALWRADGRQSYAELRRMVDHGDSGNFNYHLRKLVGQFVRKTDGGYELRYAGEQVVRAVVSGTFTRDPSLPPAEIDEQCVHCGGPLEMQYDRERVTVRCTECGGQGAGAFQPGPCVRHRFPPAGLEDRSREEAVEAAAIARDAELAMMAKAVCPECGGRTGVSFEVCPDHERGERGLCRTCGTRFEAWSIHECQRCSLGKRSPTWFAVLNHPAVIAFCHEHGLEEPVPFRTPTGEGVRFLREIAGTVVERDPYRFLVTVPADGERLEVWMDETLDVLGVERSKDTGEGGRHPQNYQHV